MAVRDKNGRARREEVILSGKMFQAGGLSVTEDLGKRGTTGRD